MGWRAALGAVVVVLAVLTAILFLGTGNPESTLPAVEANVEANLEKPLPEVAPQQRVEKSKPPQKVEAAPPLKEEVVLKAAWGGKLGQFGRRREEEANSEAPMAMIAGDGDELLVVDQVNQRVQRLRGGKAVAEVHASETVQDIASLPGGKTVLLDRLADQKIQVFDADGKLINEAPIAGKGLEEGGHATGVFADKDGIWVENDHSSLVRVADADGNADTERPELPGRPTRDGRVVLTAAITDRAHGTFVLTAFAREDLQVLWSEVVELPLPILHVLALESDAAGSAYVAVDCGREASEPPYAIIDEQIFVVRLSSEGRVTGMISLPASATGDEMLRPVTVSADGTVVVMSPGETGLTINRYTFP